MPEKSPLASMAGSASLGTSSFRHALCRERRSLSTLAFAFVDLKFSSPQAFFMSSSLTPYAFSTE